jgi:hypothetical protein
MSDALIPKWADLTIDLRIYSVLTLKKAAYQFSGEYDVQIVIIDESQQP